MLGRIFGINEWFWRVIMNTSGSEQVKFVSLITTALQLLALVMLLIIVAIIWIHSAL